MSSAVDEDAASAVEAGRATLGAAISTVQRHLQKAFIVFVLGLVGAIFAMRVWVWDFFKRNTRARMSEAVESKLDIIAQTPFDVILLQVKIGLVVGVLLAAVTVIYLSRDELRERGLTGAVPVTKARLYGLAAFALVLFAAGVFYAYTVFFPFMFDFLATNAIQVEIKPSYSIVYYTQFILLLTLSFGIAAELPLVMSALSYAEIVPYETFRDKWRYAVIVIFGFGAVASPPDPFTQIMWGIPLCGLYVFSLGFSKVVTNIRRSGASADPSASGAFRRKFLQLAAVTALFFVGAAAFLELGGPAVVRESIVPALPAVLRPGGPLTASSLRPLPGVAGTVAFALQVAIAGSFLVVMGYSLRVLREPVVPREGRMGDPTAIDLASLDAGGVRSAPLEAFAAHSEEEVLAMAREAMDAGRPEKAEALLDRFDEYQAAAEAGAVAGDEGDAVASEGGSGGGGGGAGGEGGVVTSTTAGVVDAFTEDETTEEDIGGYYYDVAFVLQTLTSRLFRIFGVFVAVMVGVFFWLYSGGIGRIKQDFLSRIPPEAFGAPSPEVASLTTERGPGVPVDLLPAATDVAATASQPGGVDDLGLVIALHPVEALIFEIKVSVIVGAVAILPLVLYYAWPALEERGFASGDRRVFFGWWVAILAGLVVGSAVGYLFVAPSIISYLVYDAVDAGMVISYRLKNFFWLIFLTTAGIGLLADVPISMVLFHEGGIVSFDTMKRRWRVAVLGVFAVAGLALPGGVLMMLIVGIPTALAYLLGLGILRARVAVG